MKNIYVLIVMLAFCLSAKANSENISIQSTGEALNDTIILTFGGGSAQIGDQICVPLYGSNFKDVVAFQWEIKYDPLVFSLNDIIPHPSITSFSFNSNDNGDGKVRMLHEDILNPIYIDSLPIIEICLDVISIPDIPTYVGMANEDFPTEIVKQSTIAEPIVPLVLSESIFIENNLDCGLILICPQNKEYVFTPGMVIHKEQFIEQYDLILQCHDYADEEVKLINMSAPGSLPQDSLIMTCDNVFYNTTIGVVIVGTSTTNTNGIITIDTVSFLNCQTDVIFNIPDNMENCTNTQRSCIDPLRCKSFMVEVTEPTTVINYSDILDSENFDECDAIIYSNYESIAAIPDPYPNGFELTCRDYDSEVPAFITIEAPLTDNHTFLGQICTSIIEITGIEEACNNDTISLSEIPVVVKSEVANIRVNGIDLEQKGPSLYAMNTADLAEFNNIITINEGANSGLYNISTLDMVLQYKILVEDMEYTAPQAIAADVDLSGSLTTNDIGFILHRILGITEGDDFNNFILEKNQQLSDLDVLNFKNDFSNYTFDLDDVDRREGFTFELFKYGDLNNTSSDYHKNLDEISEIDILIPDLKVKSGEMIKIPITLNSDESDPLVAMILSLNFEALELIEIDHDYKSNVVLHHLKGDALNLSFFDMQNESSLEIELTVKAKKEGLLSELLGTNENKINESVTNGLIVSKPILKFENSHEREEIQFFPNPANELLYITLPENRVGSTVQLYSSIGQLLASDIIQNTTHLLDLNQLNIKGLVHVVIFDENENSSFKIVAQ